MAHTGFLNLKIDFCMFKTILENKCLNWTLKIEPITLKFRKQRDEIGTTH